MHAHMYSIIFTCAEFEHSHSQYSIMHEALAVSSKGMIRVYMHAHYYINIISINSLPLSLSLYSQRHTGVIQT